jgi:hypothetical protein
MSLAAYATWPDCQSAGCVNTWHSANSLLEKLGVPESLRAAWLGHTIAVGRGAYPH